MTGTPRAEPRPSRGDVRKSLEQAQLSLHAAAATVHIDPDAALDDILAARLLVGIALMALGGSSPEQP